LPHLCLPFTALREASLTTKIRAQKKELKELSKLIELERRKQVVHVKRVPIESKYTAYKTAVIASIIPGRIKRLFGPKKDDKQIIADKRVHEIDSELVQLKQRIQNLEAEYCKQTIKEDFFREKLFEFREKMHLLELEKKKLE